KRPRARTAPTAASISARIAAYSRARSPNGTERVGMSTGARSPSPVVLLPAAIVIDGSAQPLVERRARLPADDGCNAGYVAVEVPGLLSGALRRERSVLPSPGAGDRDQSLGELPERGRRPKPNVEDLAVRRRPSCALDQRVHAIVHVEEVALDGAVAEDANRLAVDREAHEPVRDAILRMAHLTARAVDVGEAEVDGADSEVLSVQLQGLL